VEGGEPRRLTWHPEDRQLKLGFRQCPITQDSVK
jgi:hypothetical protein